MATSMAVPVSAAPVITARAVAVLPVTLMQVVTTVLDRTCHQSNISTALAAHIRGLETEYLTYCPSRVVSLDGLVPVKIDRGAEVIIEINGCPHRCRRVAPFKGAGRLSAPTYQSLAGIEI